MKKSFCVLICVVTLFSLCACSTEITIENETTTQQTEATTQAVTLPVTTTNIITTEETDVVFSETISATVPPVTLAPVPTAEKTAPPVTEQPKTTEPQTTQATITVTKTGEMAFSDDPDNRYIKAIASKYNVSASTLVALYTVPENDSNIVLEFDGTKNADGSLKRNKDTLIAIYSIKKNLESKRASENPALNEYSYGEMKVMFISTTKYIMPEFEELK